MEMNKFGYLEQDAINGIRIVSKGRPDNANISVMFQYFLFGNQNSAL